MSKIITRDMSHLRKHPKFMDTLGRGKAQLTDLSGNHKVEIDWHFNKWADADNVFKLVIDDKVVYLDLEELTYYTRLMNI